MPHFTRPPAPPGLPASEPGSPTGGAGRTTQYIEFAAQSNFTFLEGASHPEELIAAAITEGLAGLGLADINSVAGVVRAHGALRDLCKQHPDLAFRYHPGARLRFTDGTPDILAYPIDRAGWGRLCRLLTAGNRRAEKGQCHLSLGDLTAHAEGLSLIVLPWTKTKGAAPASDREANAVNFKRQPFAADTPPFPLDGGRGGDGGGAQRHPSWTPPTPTPTPQGGRDTLTEASARSSNAGAILDRLADIAPGRVRLAARMSRDGLDRRTLAETAAQARSARIPLIAVNDVLYHAPSRRPLQDVLTCIRTHTTLETAGRLLKANAERHIKPTAEMARLFRDHPEAVRETLRLSEQLTFSLDHLKYEYPDEVIDGFATAQEALIHFTYAGAAKRYPAGLPDKVRFAIAHEIELIGQLGYAQYFLTVFDIVRYARGQGILCQGRGSAANSAVCFCLGVTEVDPGKSDLLFERFVSADRREPPDIDVDFEHERREEVIQYIYRRYGRERAGLAATVISYRARSAIREVGRVFGLAEDTLDAMSGSIWGWGAEGINEIDTKRAGLDRAAPIVAETFDLARQIAGFPRHLSQHVGGFVITRGRLDELVPIQNAAMEDRTVIEWDKDDLDTLGILKIDVLGLGMLSCLRNTFNLLRRHYDRDLTIATIPAEDAAVYRMLQRADSLGVFQVESRAQMSMLPRLKPATFYDLVIEVAIVRPGPIQGDMVHPYLRRRQGLETVNYPSKELEQVLGKTLGVPLFQEQAMRIAIVAAGFTPSEADGLRRAMATFRKVGTIGTFQTKMVEGMVANGYDRAFAERCFKQLEGFGEYGFPESHAASFALLVYASCWMKCHYPDVFAAALLNAQPLGFYAPAQIVRDAREHGIDIRAPDINASDWDATLEEGNRDAVGHAATNLDFQLPTTYCPSPSSLHRRHASMAPDILSTHAVRLGLREIKGLRADAGQRIAALRDKGYDSVRDLWLRTGLDIATLERLADADCFGSLGLSRRDALWAVKALGRTGDASQDLPLFAAPPGPAHEPDANLPPMPPGEEVVNDYRFLKMSLKAHPVTFVRAALDAERVTPNDHLTETAPGRRIAVAGLVLVRQRPGSARGVIFMTLEDEGNVANVIVWPKVFEKFRPVILSARFVVVHGRLQRESDIIHLIADRIEDRTAMLLALGDDAYDRKGLAIDIIAHADEVKRPGLDARDKRLDGEAKRNARSADIDAARDRVYVKPKPQVQPQLTLPTIDVAALDRPARATRHALPKGRNFR